jgi:hypothetical protein
MAINDERFDLYSPLPAIRCPACGALLHRWQGRDAAGELFLWVQGQTAPVDQLVEDSEQVSLEARAQRRLPERFTMHTTCEICSHRAEAIGYAADGVWTESALSQRAWADAQVAEKQ